MNDAQAQARHEAAPHMSAETFAYYAGRNAAYASLDLIAGERVTCDFRDTCLRTAFWRGVRDVNSELALDADAEWDVD